MDRTVVKGKITPKAPALAAQDILAGVNYPDRALTHQICYL